MSHKTELDLNNLTLEQLAELDLQGDKAQLENGPLLNLKPVLRTRTGVRAGRGPIGLGVAAKAGPIGLGRAN